MSPFKQADLNEFGQRLFMSRRLLKQFPDEVEVIQRLEVSPRCSGLTAAGESSSHFAAGQKQFCFNCCCLSRRHFRGPLKVKRSDPRFQTGGKFSRFEQPVKLTPVAEIVSQLGCRCDRRISVLNLCQL
jgi:hypothetical protein